MRAAADHRLTLQARRLNVTEPLYAACSAELPKAILQQALKPQSDLLDLLPDPHPKLRADLRGHVCKTALDLGRVLRFDVNDAGALRVNATALQCHGRFDARKSLVNDRANAINLTRTPGCNTRRFDP